MAVCYYELDLDTQFPPELRRYIPNLYAHPVYYDEDTLEGDDYVQRVVALVSTRSIHNEELFSQYHELVYHD